MTELERLREENCRLRNACQEAAEMIKAMCHLGPGQMLLANDEISDKVDEFVKLYPEGGDVDY